MSRYRQHCNGVGLPYSRFRAMQSRRPLAHQALSTRRFSKSESNPRSRANIVSFAAGRQCRWSTCTERENLCSDAKGEITSGSNREDQSTNAEHRGGAARSRDEGSVMEPDRRGCVVQPRPWANRQREEPVGEAKPFNIPKRVV